MPSEIYRVINPTAALRSSDGTQVTLPEGAVLTIRVGAPDGKRMIAVDWNEALILIMVADLKAHCAFVGHDSVSWRK